MFSVEISPHVRRLMAVNRLTVKFRSSKTPITGRILNLYAPLNHSGLTVIHTQWVFIPPIVWSIKARHIILTSQSLLYHCAGIEENSPKHGTVAIREVCQIYQSFSLSASSALTLTRDTFTTYTFLCLATHGLGHHGEIQK